MDENHQKLVVLTADITAAHVSNNSVGLGDLGLLIASIHSALSDLGASTLQKIDSFIPLISIKSSVKSDHLVCLVCGEKLKMIKRHLNTHHQMTLVDYYAAFNLPKDYPSVSRDYAQRRRDIAKTIGLGRFPKKTKRK
jgi:predicted transcriptional regulator